MSFQKYEKYKESGVEWLGEVPKHWEVSLLKRRYQVTLGKMLKSNQTSPNETEEFYLRAANIRWRGVDTADVKRMWFTPEEKKKLKLYRDDLLVSEGGDVGRSALWDDEIEGCYIQNSINRIRAREDADTRFLFYWMYFIKHADYIDMICNKATIAHFTVEKVEATPCVYPPLEEQKRIAAFLDKETTKIDTLIDKQEQLITLLQEKRQAIIAHAVTRGLHPNVKMKDSGIEWLGEIPEHWQPLRLKWVVHSVLTGGTPEKEAFAEGYIDWFTPGDFKDEIVLKNAEKQIAPEKATKGLQFFPPNSVLIIGIGATLGKVGLIKTRSAANQQINGVIPNNRVNPTYLTFSLSAQNTFMKQTANISTLSIMNQDKTKQIPLAVPPIDEQKKIVAYLDKETTKIDTLIEKCETAIELLKERRTALISAAVTGKIDVRNAV